MFSPLLIVVAVCAYLAGAIPFALLISRIFSLPDPRTYGSGNVGATNVARKGNKTAAILTLIADGGKGAAAILIADALLPGDIIAQALAGVAAVGGHVSSLFLKFRGGRGVATSLAVYLSWQPLVGGIALIVWGLSFLLWRYSSVSSLCAAAAATTACYLLTPPPIFIAALVINIVIVLRHRDNLRRLAAGSELKVGGGH